MTIKAIFAVSAALLLSTPAAADDTPLPNSGWDYAQWGMTADAVIAASGGNAKAGNASDKSVMVWRYPNGANGTTLINGRTYALNFYFDPTQKGLTFAKISSENKADCTALARYYQTTVRQAPKTVRGLEDVTEYDDDDYWSAPIGGNKYAHFAISLTDMDICFIVVADAKARIKRQ